MLDIILCVQFVNYVPVLLCIFNTNNVIVMSAFDYRTPLKPKWASPKQSRNNSLSL